MRALLTVPWLLLAVLIAIVYVYSIIWAYGDAEARSKPGCLVALLVAFLSWPLGLLLWVVFRPEQRRGGFH